MVLTMAIMNVVRKAKIYHYSRARPSSKVQMYDDVGGYGSFRVGKRPCMPPPCLSSTVNSIQSLPPNKESMVELLSYSQSPQLELASSAPTVDG